MEVATLLKVELLTFMGKNPERWLWQAEMYFQLNSILDKDCLEVVKLYLKMHLIGFYGLKSVRA